MLSKFIHIAANDNISFYGGEVLHWEYVYSHTHTHTACEKEADPQIHREQTRGWQWWGANVRKGEWDIQTLGVR